MKRVYLSVFEAKISFYFHLPLYNKGNLSGNRLTISVYGETMIFTVTSLTAAELIIEVSGRDGDGEYYEKFTMRKVD